MNKANILLYVALLIFLSFNKLLVNKRISPLIFDVGEEHYPELVRAPLRDCDVARTGRQCQ